MKVDRKAWTSGDRTTGVRSRLSSKQLDAIVTEALVDAYTEAEELTGLFTLIEEHLGVPFATEVLGVPVTVRHVDLVDDDIVAVCVAGRRRQRIPILELPLPEPRPEGAKWIEAYRHWRRRGGEKGR